MADLAYEIGSDTARLNEQLHYVFDKAGNLNYRTNNALVENFQVNSLNELTTNTNGGTLTVMGTTTSPATNVTVNGTNNALLYGDATFAATNMPLDDHLHRRRLRTVYGPARHEHRDGEHRHQHHVSVRRQRQPDQRRPAQFRL